MSPANLLNTPCKLLVVDDDPTILRMFATALGQAGFEVTTAATGREGLRVASENPVDVVLLDINLPDLSGIDVMRQIIKTTGAIVILVTGDNVGCAQASAIQEGAADFVVKPVRLPELAMRIRHAREVRNLTDTKEPVTLDPERMAICDELTGLFNNRHFQGQLQAETRRALRYQRPLSLAVLDVDMFRSINDTLGHVEGDRVLAGIARILTARIRATDAAFRYGGEQFAVLLPETHLDQAIVLSDRLRHAIEDSKLLEGRSMTVSVGVAEYRPPEDSEAFLRRTDSALNAAKRAGRYRVAKG